MTQPTKKAAEKKGDPPIKTFRLRGIHAAVFENQFEQGVFHKVSLQRVYRDGQEWKTTQSLGREDLPVARLLLERCWEFILETEAVRNRDEQETRAD